MSQTKAGECRAGVSYAGGMKTSTPVTPLTTPPRSQAKLLYWQGWKVADIATHLNVSSDSIYSWKTRDKWDDSTPADRIDAALEARICQLIAKESKSNADYKEMDALGRQFHKFTGGSGGKEIAASGEGSRGTGERPRKAKLSKNEIGDDGLIALQDAFHDSLFDYQREWYRAGNNEFIRNILKSRRIGATWYFAREAILDAYETGKNKIFLSASKRQALTFRHDMAAFVKEATGVILKGAEEIHLPNGAVLQFLGTNTATAQGYGGDLFVDEYFWIKKFAEFQRVVSGMAAHKQYRETYISTPSTVTAEAYGFWNGDDFNARRAKKDRALFDVSHRALKDGQRGPDLQWRQIVTIHDALERGCDLFDLERLKMRYSDEAFANLFECQFMDDSQSAFPLSLMMQCLVDSYEAWSDVKPWAQRPYANRPVWIGYDPAGDGVFSDGAGLVVIAPARSKREPHRIIESHRLNGSDYETQANFIQSMTERYNVAHIGIDTNGMGESVAQLVEKFFPDVSRILYSPENKTAMVRQAQHIIKQGRLQLDSGDQGIVLAFKAIAPTVTNGGRLTYKATRSSEHGHADLAWATLHALQFEPLDGPDEGNRRSTLEFFD
ncbi:terminase large subunit domain-containing protein [Cernens ardua]|uniref:terminase large subunit domain-containing protein n=1 Tax=Cernens ardua TaxID=3402176 RepID=UPI003F9DB90C